MRPVFWNTLGAFLLVLSGIIGFIIHRNIKKKRTKILSASNFH